MSCTFSIEPIRGREAIQKNFVRLPEKSDTYSGRHPSLNERFSVIERGYFLAASSKSEDDELNVRCVSVENQSSVDDFLAALRSKTEQKHNEQLRIEAKSQSPARSVPDSIDSVSP